MKRKYLDILWVSVTALVTIGLVANTWRLDKDAQPSLKNLFEACTKVDITDLETIIKSGADLDALDPQSGSTPLGMAITFNNLAAVKLLIENGANINKQSKDGSTPLHTAAFFCRREILEYVLEKNPDQSIRNQYGQTPQDIVTAPWDDSLEGIYKFLDQILPFKLEIEVIKESRSSIAQMLNPD